MAEEIISYSEDLRPGDIISERTRDHYELARYLIVGREFEEGFNDERDDRYLITYYQAVLLKIGRSYDSIWAKTKNPGETYALSEFEITKRHIWTRLFKSPLSWGKEGLL
tara:strand:- start:293 stop:622 length:330 start_codon:yes stop_codon:yes gene_type:complete